MALAPLEARAALARATLIVWNNEHFESNEIVGTLVAHIMRLAPRLHVLASMRRLPDAALGSAGAVTSPPQDDTACASCGGSHVADRRCLWLTRVTAVAASDAFFGQPVYVYEVTHGGTCPPSACVKEQRYLMSQGEWSW